MTDDVLKIDDRPYLISALRRRRNRGRAPAGPTPSGRPSNSGRGLLMFVPASCQGRSRSLQALDIGAGYQDLGVCSVSEMPPPRVSQVLARRLPRLLLSPDCIGAARPPGYKEDVHRTRRFRRTEWGGQRRCKHTPKGRLRAHTDCRCLVPGLCRADLPRLLVTLHAHLIMLEG